MSEYRMSKLERDMLAVNGMTTRFEDTVYVVTATCGDYYCGCGIGHLLGVALSPSEAERIRDEGERAEHSYGATWWKSFRDVTVEEIAVDQLRHREAQAWGAADVELRLRKEADESDDD